MKIHIENYKNIKNITLPVEHNILTLLGPNGVGKTNILEAISYGYCDYLEMDEVFTGPYFLSVSQDETDDDYFPNAKLLRDLFSPTGDVDLSTAIINYMDEIYEKTDRPLIQKLVKDASDSLRYAEVNHHFDPSTLAVIRLVILNKIYESVKLSGVKAIILIDTPELHAHQLMENALTTIINALKDLGCVIIMSTHSQYVVSRVFTSFDQLVRVEKSDEGYLETNFVDIDLILKDIHEFYDSDEYLVHNFSRSEHIEQGLYRLLNENLEGYLITAFRDYIITAFSCKVIVMGEGSSEDVLFDYIENAIRPDWVLEYQVGFIHGWGKSTLPLFFIFLNDIGVKAFVLYDYDNDANPVHMAYMNAFNKYHFDHPSMHASYYLRPDLEGYLDFSDGEKVQSLLKPVNVYNYTFLQGGSNPRLNELLDTMKENIERMMKYER